ncbi:MAG TPA: EamA family transporter, partial [Actinomycetota bacterium]|nr:EamA family transporter [Actinomycetota bacterium]
GLVWVRRMGFPRGRELAGAALFGVLSFGAFFSFVYLGLEGLPAGAASVVMASVPLVTFVAAVLHRLERFRWRTLGGALVAIGGIAVMFGGGTSGELPLLRIGSLLAAAICSAEAAVVAKRYRSVPPVVMNGVGMAVGALMLLGLTLAFREPLVAPSSRGTWVALLYLVFLGSIATFITYLFVLRRWTATGASYAFVMAPIAAVVLAAWIEHEPVTSSLVAGGALVLVGVYVGALSHGRRPAMAARERQTRPALAGLPADCQRCP